MAYQDPMGYYMGYDPDEEERKRREQEAAAEPVTQKITYNPDGTQKMTITGTPQALSAANPNAPTVSGPVMPDQTAAETQRLQRQAAAPSQAQQQYLQYVRENESGPNYGIGYHYPANDQGQRPSTAYGTYGITAPAYQDIQRSMPQFAGRDITSLSPEEQDQAALAYRDIQKQQLIAKGQEPTEANLRGAQYAGAGGVSQYNRTGALAPGVDQATLEKRMAGAGSPASGAVQMQNGRLKVVPQEQAQTPPSGEMAPPAVGASAEGTQGENEAQQAITAANQRYQAVQDNPTELLAFARDTTVPQFLRERARDQVIEQTYQERERTRAEKQISTMTPKQVSDSLRKDSREGSWVKAILFGILGMEQSQKEEAAKLGIGKWEDSRIQLPDGSEIAVQIKRAPNGQVLSGTRMDGTPLTTEELGISLGAAGKASDVSMTPVQAMVNGELHTFSVKRTASGLQYKDNTAGTGWTNRAPAGMTHVGQQDPAHVKGLTAKNAIETKMRKANEDARGVGGPLPYTEAQITASGNQAYQGIAGKPFGGIAGVAEAPPVSPTTAATAEPAGKPGAKSQAQAILDYEVAPPTGPTTPAKTAILNEVQRLAAEQGKSFDAGRYKIVNKTRQDFTTGQQGKAVQSMNVAVDHLDSLGEAAEALKNSQIPLFNKIGQEFAKQTGLPQPTDFDALKTIVGSEVAKAVAGGATALGDRAEIREAIEKSNSPEQLAGVIKRYQQLMAGQVKGLRQTFTSSGLGEDEFDKKLLPRTRKVLNEMEPPSRSKW